MCRSFPGGGRCGYYDFLSFERRAQEDDEFVALTNHEDDLTLTRRMRSGALPVP